MIKKCEKKKKQKKRKTEEEKRGKNKKRSEERKIKSRGGVIHGERLNLKVHWGRREIGQAKDKQENGEGNGHTIITVVIASSAPEEDETQGNREDVNVS